MYASIKPVISKTFFDLLKIGFGGQYYNLFLDPNIILFVIIDSYLGYLLVNLSNDIFTNINSNNNNNINIWSILAVIFLPLIININGLLFNKAFLKKKHLIFRLGFSHKVFNTLPSEISMKKIKKRPPIFFLKSLEYFFNYYFLIFVLMFLFHL